MGMRLKRTGGGETDFQMAPMIDMVFLLLVFFMTVSTLAQEEKVPLALPESETSEVADEVADRGTISLETRADGSLQRYLGSVAVTRAEMQTQLKAAVSANPDLRINVRAMRETPFRDIRQVLRDCAEAGAYDIIYATHQEF